MMLHINYFKFGLKEDIKEVSKGYDCGLQVKDYNDIKIGDIVEFFNEVAIKKKL